MVGLKELDQIDYGVAYQRGAPSLTQQSGLAGLVTPTNAAVANASQNAMSDLRNLGTMKIGAPPAAAAPQGPVLAISRSSGKIWANGKLFTLDDAQGAIESEQYLNQPPAPAPAAEASDWEALDQDAYAQHLAGIKNPGMGTLASKNFGIGVDNAQLLGGYGLQFLGATETGQSIVKSQLEDLNKNAPYQRNFEDIGSDPNRGVLDWFVANLAQQGPNLVESVVTAAIGAAAGGAAGGGPNPATAVGGAITSLVGKQAFKQALLGASKKYMAGEALDAAEKKLLFEAAGLTAAAKREIADRVGTEMVGDAAGAVRMFGPEDAINLGARAGAEKAAVGGLAQAKMGGAAIATGAQNYATGVSDLYGDSIDGGNPDRGYAALGGVPYAAMESLPEFIAALRIFKGVGASTTSLAGKGLAGKAGEIGLRAARGGAAGAALEGSTELGQEALGIGANDAVDLDSPEGISRMLNAFAAGAAIGGFIGAGSNMNTGKPHDLLSAGAKPADLNGPTLTGDVIPPTRPGGSMVGPDGSVPLLGGPGAAAPMLEGSAAPATPNATVSPTPEGGTFYAGYSQGQPAPGATPATPVSPTPAPTQPNMLQLPEPTAPAQAAPVSATPSVIPMGGPIGGSALQQAATGQLQGGVPPALPNRLQQMQAEAKQRQLEATSGSALARLGRGDLPVPLNQPGGEVSMAGEASGQMVQPMTGKAKLKRGKKVMQIEGMPQQAVAPVQEMPNAAQEGQVKPGDKLKRKGTGGRLEAGRVNREVAPQVQEAGNPPSRGDKLKQGRKSAEVQAEVSKYPVHDKFVAEFDDAQLNLAEKSKLKAIVKRAVAAGVLTEGDVKELDIAFKDRDMTVDDIAPLATSLIEANKTAAPAPKPGDKLKRAKAPENGKQDVPAEVKAELPEVKKPPKLKLAPVTEEPTQKAKGGTDTPLQQFVKTYADPQAFGGMRTNPNLRDVVKYTDWLGSLSEADLTKLEPVFARSDNPFLNAGSMDVARVRAKLEAALGGKTPSPKAEGAAAAPAQKADTPKNAVAVYNPAPIVDPEKEAYARAQQAKAVDATLTEVSGTDAENEVEAEEAISQIDSAKLDEVELREAVSYLMRMARDSKINKKLRDRISRYLDDTFEQDELALFNRTQADPVTKGSMDFDVITTTMEQINNGELRLTASIIGQLTAAWKRLKASNPDFGVGKLADYIKGGPQFFNMKDGKVVPKGTGRYSTTMWDTPDGPMDIGKTKLSINKFTSGLAKKPKVHVFRDQAHLKASDPKLYARMAAGRDGDFDTVKAAGYSMGDEVLIFSDRIGSEQHLAFVLAHETLGHFGMRGLMGKGDFDKLMTSLYDTDSRLKIAVDAAMAVRNMSKAEAVEEYLSDYAGQLHTSLVLRVWKGIKGVLNRVGIKFGDEATRYLLSQSNRYVKTGERAGVFETSSVLNKLWGVESGHVGRFTVADVASENDAAADMLRWGNVWPTDLKNAGRVFKDYGLTWDTFKEQIFSLANFQALRNPGLYEFRKLMDEASQREQYIYNRYKEKLEKLLYRDEKYRDKVSRMMMAGRVVSVYRLLENPLNAKDAKEKLFSINEETGDLVRNVSVIDSYIQRGMLSFEEMRDGVTYKREMMDGSGKVTKVEQKFDGFKDITKDQYNDYVLARRTIAEVEVELLEAKYANYVASERVSSGAIKRMLKKANISDAEKMVKRTINKYKDIYTSGYTVDERGNLQPDPNTIIAADEFLQAVNKALISADAKNDPEVRKFFEDQKQADDFAATMTDFRDKRKVPNGDLTYLFQNEMKRVILEDVNLGVEEERAKRSMVGGYVPVIRDKAFEVRIEAYGSDGKPVKLHEDMRKLLVYSQFDSLSEADRAAEVLDSAFTDKKFEVYADVGDGRFETTEVTLRTVRGPALTQVATDPALNLDEFLHGLRLFNIQLRPEKMTEVIKNLTASGDQLRKRLEFSNTPGADKNMGVFAMSRHIQLRGATIAKTITRPRMRELMDRSNPDSRDLWYGDKGSIFSLYKRWTDEANPSLKQHYRHQLDLKLSMFNETFPGSKGWDGSVAGYDKLVAENKLNEVNANRFYNNAQNTLEFLEKNTLVTEGNFGAGRAASIFRAATSIFQLGGSIAQGVMNMVSPYTNWLPYMASYNAKNGFGGGFSAGKVIVAYQMAMNQVGIWGLKGGEYNTAGFYEQLTRNKAELAKVGLTIDEAEALAGEIREGKLQPAQANALLGMARTGTSSRFWLRSIDIFMAPFNVTEQASRRSSFLAAYRLAKERNMADDPALMATEEGKKERDRRLDEARAFAIQSIDLTMGEYTVLNRPPVWRDGIQSFLYMYKVYPTTTIQMFRRMDRKGQALMLGTLLIFSGVPGFPFAEDLEDLIDTIAQALGLQMGSVRAALINALEDISPGLSPYVLKGAINTALGVPADVASRFSMGDFVPGTGLLLAGSTIGEEVKDILGPMPAMVLGSATTARDLVSFPFSESKTFQGAMRGSPITLARMLGDTWAYLDNGAIVDKRGYVVSPDMNIGIIASRLAGFYPKDAANQYDAIRVAKRINNYQKEVVAGFRTAWIRERAANSYAGMRRIEQTVDDWNRSAKHTGLEIANFRKNSERAYKEATLSAAERTLKATSKAGREDTTRLMDAILATE